MKRSPNAKTTIGKYMFVVPKDWTSTTYPDGVVFASPVQSNGEACQLTIFPMRKVATDLLGEAVGVFEGLFKTDPLSGYPSPSPSIVKGISPYGWEYVTIRKSIGGT